MSIRPDSSEIIGQTAARGTAAARDSASLPPHSARVTRLHRPRLHRAKPHPEICPNCAHPVAAHRFCPACGQEAKHPEASLGEILADAWEEFVKIDSRLLKTVVPLLFKPGFLTREYVAGRRIRYIAPFRLYFTISFLFFLAVSYRSTAAMTAAFGPQLLSESLPDFAKNANSRFSQRAAATGSKMRVALDSEAKTDDDIHFDFDPAGISHSKLPSTVAEYDKTQLALPPRLRDNATKRFLIERGISTRSRSPLDLISSFFNTASKAMILLLPAYALLLQLLYWRRRRSYVEHFVFALHVHSALFLAATFYLLLPLAHEDAVLAVVFTVYGLIALKTVYGQSVFKTLVKSLLLLSNYALLLMVALLLAAGCSLVF